MRGTFNAELLKSEDGNFVGFNLGADYCAEHEWGIKGIQRSFGIPGIGDGKVGIDARRITTCPEGVAIVEMPAYRRGGGRGGKIVKSQEKEYALCFPGQENSVDSETAMHPGRDVSAAWDERGFAVRVREKHRHHLDALLTAFGERDVAIWIGGARVFQNGGLCIVIASSVPADLSEKMRASDVDRLEMRKASDATGIEESLRKAGKRWYALSPRWAFPDEAQGTQHRVVYWLNPMEQNRYSSGWFTVEDLMLWAKDIGPVTQKRSA